MKNNTGQNLSRRVFMKDGARSVLFGGFILMGSILGFKSLKKGGGGLSCGLDLPCRICSVLPGCSKDRARDYRRLAKDQSEDLSGTSVRSRRKNGFS